MRDATTGWAQRVVATVFRIVLSALVVVPVSAWSALALWFRLPAPEWVRAFAAGLIAVLGLATIAALFFRRSIAALTVFAVVFGALLVWWSTIRPPTDGDWAPDVARQTTGTVEGDILTLSDVRDFEWRTDDDFTERWSKRSYDLSKLKTLDLFLAYWAGPEMAHVIMSFGFEGDEYLAWSVEVRREKTGEFSPVADAFRNHTLIYLATTERDSVRLRANVRGEDVRLYRLNTPPEQAKLLLLEYASQSTALAARPKFYNSITANCATVVAKLVRAAGGTLPLDWRLVVNGFLPGFLYDRGAVVTTMPLSELMARARIDDQAKAADQSPDFSRLIRVGVPSPWDQPPK
jgi:predicted signal transduction protein with EAL and GGDEF domain